MKVVITILVAVMLMTCLAGLGAAVSTRSHSSNDMENGVYNADDIPVGIETSWITNSEGYLCLRLDITNNGDKTIRDIQGVFYFTDYGYNDTVIGSYDWPAGRTLYLYDADGQDIYGKSKTKIKRGETLSLVIEKISRHDISFVFDVCGYITWIDFGSAGSWGTRDIRASETTLESRAFKIEVQPVYG